MNQEEQNKKALDEAGKKMSQLIAKCWSDDGFKRKLLADPAGTLKAEGSQVPAGLTIKAVENTDNVYHLVIPAKPTELSDADLDTVSGGAAYYSWSTPCVQGPACWSLNGSASGCLPTILPICQAK
ncbi:MAG TPA: NHLP leader peptide family RiPP precursor [Lacipirellulaceae bacterium]|jgi:hypothetical protein|nr:NHLP leader peptide family RiPP precursor [Lacipirellulaceae bacterium]